MVFCVCGGLLEILAALVVLIGGIIGLSPDNGHNHEHEVDDEQTPDQR